MKAVKCVVFILAWFSLAHPQWSTDPSENTRVTSGGLLPHIITDGAGGAFIVYQDSPALLRQVWVQWLDRFGYVRFPDNGIRISSADRYQSPYYYLVSDSAGGVIVLFEELHLVGDEYSGETYNAVYAQRIDSSGAKLWEDAGIELSPFAEGKRKSAISACSDGNHGAFVFWGEDADSNGVFELRAQRITADGEFAWPDSGIIVSDKFISDNLSNPNPAVSDGSGNAIILYSENSWEDSETKLQKLSETGDFLWGEGVNIYPLGRQMISDNSGGAVIAGVRREFDGVSVKYIMRAQRVDDNGQALWGEKGVCITEKSDKQTFFPEIAYDTLGNTVLVWRDRRSGSFNIYTQMLNTLGSPLWEIDGIMVSEFDSQKSLLGNGIASALNGNHVIVWRDQRFDGGLYGQKLNSTGLKLWGKDDIAISIRNAYQREHRVISDLAGGAIVCWYEIGTGSGWGIFAQQVSRRGNLGEVLITSVSQPDESFIPSQYILHQSYPNPFNAEMVIKYEIPDHNHVALTIYDITGKEVITLINRNQAPGVYQVKWNGKNSKGDEMASGIYIYQLCAGNFVESKKAIYVK